MIIDSHVHIFPPRIISGRGQIAAEDAAFRVLYDNSTARLVSVDALIEMMDKHEISRCVISGFGYYHHDLCIENNEYILDSVARFPERLMGLITVQPNSGDKAIYELERCILGGARGVGEMRNDLQGFSLENNEVVKGILKILARDRLVWLTHTSEPVGHIYPGKGNITPEKIYPFIKKNPSVKIVLAHLGGGLPFYASMPEVKEILENVYFDTSASPLLYGYDIFKHVVELVGASHILFGSDYPLLNPERVRRQLEMSDLNKDDVEQILFLNAKKVFIDDCQ
jgi:predicted TIM-barrel fold metal-dependent hydrolase